MTTSVAWFNASAMLNAGREKLRLDQSRASLRRLIRAGVAWLGPAFLGRNAVRLSGRLVTVG